MLNRRLQIALRFVVLTLLSFAHAGRAAEIQDSSKSKAAETYAGEWTAIGELQGYFERLSSTPISPGESVKLLEIRLMKPEELWGESSDFQRAEPRVKKLLAEANHNIVAAGVLARSIERLSHDGDVAFFLLTQSDGETFLCPLSVDGDASFELWRVHRIPGKERSDDVLIVEFGKAGRKQISALKRVASKTSE